MKKCGKFSKCAKCAKMPTASKGQLISEGNFDAFKSSKKRTISALGSKMGQI